MIIASYIRRIFEEYSRKSETQVDSLKILQGVALANQNAGREISELKDAEFKVFSQWGDDGIIQYLVNRLKIERDKQVFVEFGVESYRESNTRFLLIKDNWKGLIIDASKEYMDAVKSSLLFWQHQLSVTCSFITKDNINQIIAAAGISGEIGLLSVDIDGNDYWVWKAIDKISPMIVISEYNAIFGFDKPYTVIYKEDFVRTDGHYSNLFYGTSLLSACDLAEEKGYDFVGCNNAGNNAYFIRKDLDHGFKKLTAKEGFVDARFRESRDKNGSLTYLSGEAKQKEIKGIKLYNTRTKTEEVF